MASGLVDPADGVPWFDVETDRVEVVRAALGVHLDGMRCLLPASASGRGNRASRRSASKPRKERSSLHRCLRWRWHVGIPPNRTAASVL